MIEGLQQFTSKEEMLLQHLSGIPYKKGDILYFDGKVFHVLPIGKFGEILGISKQGDLVWLTK